MLEAENVILAVVALGIVISPELPPLGAVTINLRFRAPQTPLVLSTAVKVEVWALPVIRICVSGAIVLKFSVISEGKLHETTVTVN